MQHLGAQVDAGDWLAEQLEAANPDHLSLVYHTIAWQYFPVETQQKCLSAIETASQSGPVTHLAMEPDEQLQAGAAVTLTLWPVGKKLTLGRADFHGRWVDWRSP